MPIPNPTPVTPGACTVYWLSDLTVCATEINATLRPSDGTHVIANNKLKKNQPSIATATNPTAKALVDSILALVQTLAKSAVPPTQVSIHEADPLEPIPLNAWFPAPNGKISTWSCPDLYKLVTPPTPTVANPLYNPQAAAVYESVLAFFGAT